jgi:pseudouridine synthase
MIFTNDGDLLHEITHPRYRCTKEYYVVLSRVPGDRVLSALRKGVFLPDVGKKTSPAVLNRLRRKRDGTATIHIQIQEGLKRQIRRMFSGQGIKVTYLKRISIGGLELGNLAAGKFRELSAKEIDLMLSGSNENRPPQRQRSGGR